MTAKTRIWFFLIVLAAVLAAPTLVRAGGWAVVTLDRLPDAPVAGQAYPVGFTVRQHGQTPLEIDRVRVEARHVQSGQTAEFFALPEGKPGHYQAELLLPTAGRWVWGIESGLFPKIQPMPDLAVVEGASAAQGDAPSAQRDALAGETVPAAGRLASPALIGPAALLSLLGGLVLIARQFLWRRAGRFYALAGAGLILLSAGLAFAFFSTARAQAGKLQPPAAVEPAAEAAPAKAGAADPAETGRQLFLAKGCVVCHIHTRALKDAADHSVEAGPTLTTFRGDPTYLHSLLKDPRSVRPNAEMPNLELKKEEIEALIAFINDSGE